VDPGSTFVGYDRDNHLYIVLSIPDGRGRVALANLTSHGRPGCGEHCLLLAPSDHAFIRHPSCIPFRRAKLEPLVKLEEARDKGAVTLREPLAPEVLLRIQQAALNDIHPPRNFKLAVRQTLQD
jgi:hypothetical protein